MELPNSIAMMPMGVFSPRLLNQKTGAYTKDGADYYIERAKGGTGLIVTGVVPIIPIPARNPVNFIVMELLDYYKVNVIKNAVVESYQNGVAAVIETEKNCPNAANRAKRMFALGPQGMKVKHEIPADHIVVSVGYTPENSLYEKIKGDKIHLIGDAKQPTNVMDAIWAAYETAMNV